MGNVRKFYWRALERGYLVTLSLFLHCASSHSSSPLLSILIPLFVTEHNMTERASERATELVVRRLADWNIPMGTAEGVRLHDQNVSLLQFVP